MVLKIGVEAGHKFVLKCRCDLNDLDAFLLRNEGLSHHVKALLKTTG